MKLNMETNPRFALGDFLAADLRRQWILLNDHEKLPPSGFALWVGLMAPRFVPVLLCRVAHWLYLKKLSPLAKFVSLLNFFLFGIEIAVRCPIGPGLFFPHTQGTVIGAWQIGSNATIFQGVTLGAKEVDFSYMEEGRPSVCDDVIIGSGAKVLGGVLIGDRVRIGANSVVLSSIPADTLAIGAPARSVSSQRA